MKLFRVTIMRTYSLCVAAWWTAVLPQTVLRCAVWAQRYEVGGGGQQHGGLGLWERLSLKLWFKNQHVPKQQSAGHFRSTNIQRQSRDSWLKPRWVKVNKRCFGGLQVSDWSSVKRAKGTWGEEENIIIATFRLDSFWLDSLLVPGTFLDLVFHCRYYHLNVGGILRWSPSWRLVKQTTATQYGAAM